MTTLAECQAAIDATPTDGICHLPGGLVCCTSAEGQRGRSGKFAGLYICPAALADPRIAAHSAAGLAP